jgi:hypothetical protein
LPVDKPLFRAKMKMHGERPNRKCSSSIATGDIAMKQKNRIRLFGSVIAVTMLLAACGSGGGGSDGGGGTTPAAVPNGTFTKTYADSGSFATISGLLSANPARYMLLYRPADIKASGRISSISFLLAGGSGGAVTCPDATVTIGLSSSATLSTTYAANLENGNGVSTTILNAASWTIPNAVPGEYATIELATPFYYNGVDNLVIDISHANACTGSAYISIHGVTTAYNPLVYNQTSNTATSGSGYNFVPDVRFQFSGGDDLAYYGSYGSYIAPFSASTALRHVQMLHPATTIDGSGPITGIGMVVAAPTIGGTYTATIKLGHAVRSALTQTYADNFDHGSPVMVANNVVFTVPANVPAGSTLWMPITGSFTYNGTNNLIVDIDVTGGSAADTEWAYSIIGSRSVYGASGNSTGTVDVGALLTKFRFYGGTMDAMTPGNVTYSLPFTTGSSAKVQSYYDPSMMGSSGTISRIAFRLRNNSVADTYNNVVIVMGHTVASGLTTTFADNMVDAQTVFSGTLTIPAGMKAGDWFEIPLSTAFAYDGKRNLVVQTASDAGTFSNAIVAGTASYYTNRVAWSLDRTLPTGALQPIVLDQRFWYSK